MTESRVLISDNDEKRLRRLIRSAEGRETGDATVVERLEASVKGAVVLRSSKIPEDIVTMNSCVRLRDLESGQEEEIWLRFATDERSGSKSCPVLSGLGTALLGSREGEVIEWTGTSGARRSRIMEIVYQPERLGNHDL